MGLFGWGKKQLIKDLPADQMVLGATQLLRKSGRNLTSYRLIYHALMLNPYHPDAIIRLAEFFDDGHLQHGKPTAEQMLSGPVLEYALSPESQLPTDQRVNLQKMRLQLLWSWGYEEWLNNETVYLARLGVNLDISG